MDGMTRPDARSEAAAASIRQLRNRLLDLTAKNPLIGFRHSEKRGARVHVRAVNTGINHLFAHLADGKAVPVRPFAEPGNRTGRREIRRFPRFIGGSSVGR